MIVKPSIAFEDMRKSAGGVTASRNKSRLYVKNRISPRNPRTESQMNVRSRLSANSKAWGELTQEQRDAWNAFALTVFGRRILGSAAKISGFNCYVRLANNLSMIDQAPVSTPPLLPEFPIFEIVSVSYTAASEPNPEKLEITFSGLASLTSQTLVIRTTANFSAGKNSLPSALREIGTYTTITSNKVNITDGYKAKFGTVPAIGMKIEVETYLIDNATGVASLKQTFVWLRGA